MGQKRTVGLGLQSNSPVTPKLQASRVALCEVVTLTSRHSSSRDQLLAWATYCRVAVMYTSGTNRPPRHTWMFCGKKQPVRGEPHLLSQVRPGPLPGAPAAAPKPRAAANRHRASQALLPPPLALWRRPTQPPVRCSAAV